MFRGYGFGGRFSHVLEEEKMNLTTQERFLNKVAPEPNTGCWLWMNCINHSGYGMFGINRKAVLAHRYSYEYYKGEIPTGLSIDHICSVRSCVNPDHLDAVTAKENTQRTHARGRARNGNEVKTHCREGHLYSGDNLYVLRTQPTKRNCRICSRTNMRRYQRKKRSSA